MAQGAERREGHRAARPHQRRKPPRVGERHQRPRRGSRLRRQGALPSSSFPGVPLGNIRALFMLTGFPSRRTLARLHLRAADVPPAGAQDALRHAHCAPQHRAADGRDMPGPAQGRVDAGVQRAGVRARRAHAAELSRDGQPAQRGCRGAAEGRRRRWHEEARRVLVCR